MNKKQQQLNLAGVEIMRALRLLLLLPLLLLLYITVACAEVIFEERFEGTTESIPTLVLFAHFSCWKWFLLQQEERSLFGARRRRRRNTEEVQEKKSLQKKKKKKKKKEAI